MVVKHADIYAAKIKEIHKRVCKKEIKCEINRLVI